VTFPVTSPITCPVNTASVPSVPESSICDIPSIAYTLPANVPVSLSALASSTVSPSVFKTLPVTFPANVASVPSVPESKTTY